MFRSTPHENVGTDPGGIPNSLSEAADDALTPTLRLGAAVLICDLADRRSGGVRLYQGYEVKPTLTEIRIYPFVSIRSTINEITKKSIRKNTNTPSSLAVKTSMKLSATVMMNSATAGAIRKLKDDQSNYLWQMGLAAGQPERLLGYPVEIWEQMQDIGANTHPVAFGDFRRGYILAQRSQIRITVDANLTTPGRIKYFVRRREGGTPSDNNSLKFLKTT